VQLRLLSPPAAEHTVDTAIVSTAAPANLLVNAAATSARAPSATRPSTTEPAAAPRWGAHAPMALAWLWLAGLLAQLPAMLRQAWQARRLLREATPAPDASLLAQCAAQSRALGLRRAPALRISAAITSPQVLGWPRPTILLPAGQALSDGDTSLALIHELAHVRRGDLWLGWVPAIAQRLFFFHPLVAWAMREYALAREAACDAQVLAQPDIEPRRYGQLLLRLGVAHPLRAGLAGASPSFGNLKRRLTMLQNTPMLPRQRVQGWLLVAVIAVAGVLPYRVTATASGQPATPARSASTAWIAPAPPAPPAPPPSSAPALPTMAAPAAPPAPPAPPAPLTPPAPPAPIAGMGSHMMISTHDDTGYAFALLDGNSTTVNGTTADLAAVRRLRQHDEPLLWFRHGDAEWIIRDRATLERAKAIYAPLSALAEQQGKLGEQQGALGEKQGRLGEEQGRIAAQQGEFAARQAELAGKAAELAARRAAFAADTRSGESAATLDARQRELDAARAALDQQQPDVAGQQAAMGARQAELGRQQAALGKQQEALGRRQQEASAKAEKQMAQLLEEAVAKGLAQKAKRD
jgi:beta-lactamase regulating signal transducer with metallopeptidase domain